MAKLQASGFFRYRKPNGKASSFSCVQVRTTPLIKNPSKLNPSLSNTYLDLRHDKSHSHCECQAFTIADPRYKFDTIAALDRNIHCDSTCDSVFRGSSIIYTRKYTTVKYTGGDLETQWKQFSRHWH